MNTKINVINVEHSVVLRAENSIIAALSGRAGKWVGQHILYSAAENIMLQNMNINTIIEQMLSDDIIERAFITLSDKLHRSYQAPMYRITHAFK